MKGLQALVLLTISLSTTYAHVVQPRAPPVLDDVLEAHNSFRAQHGADPLTWNDSLASAAETWAKGCVFEHSNGKVGKYGENLAAGYGNGYNAVRGVKDWTDESSQYDPKNPQYSHFTQVVWKSTKQLGCATANCGNKIFGAGSSDNLYLVCEYDPPGNVIGQFENLTQANRQIPNRVDTCIRLAHYEPTLGPQSERELNQLRPSNLAGILITSYMLTLYITLAPSGIGGSRSEDPRRGHVKAMLVISTVMNIVATAHLAVNHYCYLLAFRGDSIEHTPEFVVYASLTSWHNIAKALLLLSQVVLGSSVALYRTWIIWNRNYKVICFPFVLLFAQTVSWLAMVAFFTSKQALARVDLVAWVKSHAIILIIMNLTTTSLMVYRIWSTVLSTSRYFTSKLAPLPKIVIESAMLQLVAEVTALTLFVAGSRGFLIAMEAITPVIGITFNALTIRIKLLTSRKEIRGSRSLSFALASGSSPTVGPRISS
ncbi:hypothetical protein PQX77_019586 [Marasmius sp. AFHP31]|nr:hypothetical protein PQX77_019586 [Marasmius sp. AFHP31]